MMDNPVKAAPFDARMNSVVRGYSSAFEMLGQKEQQERTLLILAHLARQRLALDAGAISVAQAASEIRSAVERGAVLDPETFAQLAKTLRPDVADVELSSAILRGASTGLYALGGVLLTAESAGLGAVALLAGLGSMTDTAISRFGPDALRDFFPPMSDDAVLGITAWAVKQLSDLSLQSPKTLEVAVELNGTHHLPVNPKQEINDIINRLPDSIQSLLSPHLNPSERPPSPQATAEAIRKEISRGVEKLDKKTEDYLKNGKERNAVVQAMKEAQGQERAQYIAQEVVGIGIIGNLLLSNADPKLGRQFQGFAQAGAAVYRALTTPRLGPLALAGTLASAASTIFGLFGDQPDPLVQLLEKLNHKIDLVLERLDFIAQQQVEIFRQLGEIYAAIATTQAQLVGVRNQIESQAIGAVEAAVANERVLFDNSKRRLETLLTNNAVESIGGNQDLRASYDEKITDCFTFAHDTARSPNSAGNLTLPQTPQQWRETIRSRGRSDRLIGILPDLAGTLGVTLPARVPAPASGPVSPTSWAEGVGAFLEGRTRAASLTFTAETDILQQLWRDGTYLRDLIIVLTSAEAIAAAGRRLRTAAGIPPDEQILKVAGVAGANTVVGEIYRAALTFDQANVRRVTVAVPSGKGKYLLKTRAPTAATNYSVDYFQLLLDSNLIKKEDCTPAGFPSGGNNCFFRITAEGPFKNRLLVLHKVTIDLNPPMIFYPAASGSIPDEQIFTPLELQDSSREIALAHIDRPLVLKYMPKAIKERLNQITYADFEYWGEVIRFLGALVHWRAALNDGIDDLLLANSSGPFSLVELGLAMEDWIQTRLSWAGNWPFEIAGGVDECLISAIERLRTQSATIAPNKSVPAIDETLRRLTGYMISRSIRIPT